MTLLNPDKSWASLSVWGEPEKPSRVLVRERGLEWELRGNGTAKPFVFKVVSRGPGGSVTSFSIPVTNVTGTMLTSSSWCDNLMLTTEHERGGPAVLEAIGKALTGSGVAVGKMPAAQPVDWPGKPDAKQMQGAWVRHQGGNNEYVFLTIRPDGTWARGRFYGSPENPVRIGVDQEGPDWKPQQGLFKEWGAHFTVTKRPDGGDSSWGGPVDRLTTDAMVLNGAYQRAGSLLAARLALAEPIPLTPTTNPSHAVTAKRLAQPGWVVNLTGVTLAEALGQFEARLGGRIRVDWADLWLAGVAPGCEVNYHPPVEATLEQALQGMFRSLEEATFCRVEKDGVVHVGLDAELWSKSQEKRSDRAGYAKGQELLAKRWPKIEIVDKELGWAIDMIREQQAIEIHVKWRALEAIGITARTKVSFTLPAGEAKEALAALVAGISPKVIYEIDDGIIIISAAGDPALLPRLVQKTYDIRDLLMAVPDFKGPSLNPAPPVADGPAMGWHFEASSTAPRPATVPAGPSEQEMADRIFEAIKKNIAPDSWNRPGVMLGRLHGKLILTQTAAVHNEVEKLLRRMEFEIGKQTLIEARFITVPVSESGFHEFLTTTARAVFAPGADGSQAATITPIQDDLILQMAQGRRGILVRTAPRIMLLNGQRSYVITGIHGAALLPGLEGAKEAPAFFGSGLALDIRTAVSDDLRQVTLTARPMMTSMPDVANSKDAQYAEGSVTARVDFGQTLLVQVPVQHREAIGVRQVKDARTGITQPQVVEKPLPAQMTLYVMIKPRLAMGFAREPAFPPSATQPAGGLNLTGVTLAEALGQFEARLGGRIRVDWADLWLADLTPDSKVNYQPPAEATLEQALQGMCRSLEEAAFCRVEKDGVVRVGLDVELWHRSYDRRFNPAGYARSQELLAKRWPKIEIVDQDLGQALKTLKSQGLAVQVWWRDLERIGITPKTKVTLALPAGTTKEVMDAFVAGISPKAAYKFDTGVEGITVSTVEGLNPSIVQRTYDVRDLLIPVRSFEPPDDAIGTGWRPARGAASRPATPLAEPSQQEMDDRLREGSWQGDKVQLGRMHGKLIVTQTPDVHKEVEKLLQRMRFDKAKTAQVETKFITLPAGDKGVVEYLARQGHAGLTGGADGVPQATITATQADAIAALAKANAGGGVLATPRVLLRNGGRAWISMGSEQAATLPGLEGAGDTVMYYPVGILTDLAATVSDDLRSVTVTARPFTAALKDDKKPLQTEQSRANVTARLDKGQVLLLQIPIERRQVLGVRLIKDAATGNTQPHVVEKPLPSQEVLYALVSAEIALHKDERAEFPPPPSFASTRPAGGLSIEYKAWLKTISLRDGTLTYRWATLKPDQRPSKNLAAYDSHTFSRALTAEELRLMGRWVQIYRIFALPTRLEQPFPAATDNPSRLLVTQGDDRYEVDLTARLIPDNLALAIASLDAFCRRISDAEDLISSMGDRAVMTVNEAQMLSLQVVSDVPPALAAERDAALAKAQADLAVGIVKLAERFPVLKKGRDFDRLTAAPLPGRISVWLMHIDKGKAKSHDHVPDGERFQVCVSVGPPPEVATATMPSPLYRRLGLVGETGLQADNGQLQSALKLLVADALAPLDALEAKAAQSPTVPPATKSGAATEAPEAVKALEGQIASLSERWAKVQSRWGATPPAGRAELQKQLDEIAAQAAQVDEKISQAWETMVGRPITVEGDAVRDKDGTHLLPSPGQFPYRIPLGEAPPNLRGGQRVAVRATGVLQLDKHTVTQAEVDQYKRDVLDTKNPKQMQYGRDRVGDVIREFYLKDLEVTVLSAATQPAGEWGAADAGVRIRLRALTEAIEAGLFPRLAIDIRNQAAGTLAVASEFLELEVDGQWYGHQQFDSLFIGPVDLPAGQGQDGYL
ncbi:MAG: hypothetical protein NT031_15180, partial [Planctomycetota bacterium]|nr:hypothetical protein [Planctomycetota bacterium]